MLYILDTLQRQNWWLIAEQLATVQAVGHPSPPFAIKYSYREGARESAGRLDDMW